MGKKENNSKKIRRNKKIESFNLRDTKVVKAKKKPWTLQEDNQVIDLVAKHGPQRWPFIAKFIPGRQGKQCRERWYNHLNPQIIKADWNENQEWILFLAHTSIGSKWADMTRMLKGRTDNAIKNHWNSTMQKKIPYYEQILAGNKQIYLDIFQNTRKSFLSKKGTEDEQISLQKELLESIFVDKQNIRRKFSSSKSQDSENNIFGSLSKRFSNGDHERVCTAIHNKIFDQQFNSIKTDKIKEQQNLFSVFKKQPLQPLQNVNALLMETPPRIKSKSANQSKLSDDQSKSQYQVIHQESAGRQQQNGASSVRNLMSPSNFLIKMSSNKND